MDRMIPGPRSLITPLVIALFVLAAAACSQAAPPAPTAAPQKPGAAAAPPTSAPAAPAAPAAATSAPAAQPAQPAKKAPIEFRASSSLGPGHVIDDTVNKFGELVSQKSNGEMRVTNVGFALGVEYQAAQTAASGGLDMGMISNGNSARFTNAYYPYDLPFMFKNYANMEKSLESPIGKRLLAQFEKDGGLKLLFTMTYAVGRDIETRNKQLKVPADIKGLKIRVIASPVDLATFKAWGANPTPVDWGQTFAALQQGVVDGLQVPLLDMGPNKLYEVVKYLLRIEYQALFQNFFMNPKKFESLSPAHQKIILDAAAEAQAWNRKEAAVRRDQSIKDITTNYGMTFYTPTPDEYAQWASIREKVWAEVGEELKGKIDMDVAKQIYESQ